MALRIVLFGAPGAGKGTQAVQTARDYGVVHISTGDIFRRNLREDTDLGREAKKFMDAGELVPDEVTVGMVKARLQEPDCENGFILDGFPRTVAQAEALTKFMDQEGIQLDGVVNMNVEDDLVVQRLSSRRQCGDCGAIFNVLTQPPSKDGVCDRCGGELIIRPDDNPDTIRNRLKVYRDESSPVLDYYRERSLVMDVDGGGSIEYTADEVDRVLAERVGVTKNND